MLDTNEENLENTSEKVETKKEEIKHVSEENYDHTATDVNDEEEEIDYSDFTLKQLVVELKKLIDNNAAHTINNQVKAIKNAFSSQFAELLANKKEAFLADGGESIDFKFHSPEKIEFNQLMANFRNQRDTYYKNLDKELNANLERRHIVIDELKNLIDNANPATMYQQFREIQSKWNQIGQVPKSTYNDTWKTYHFHVDRFYDLLHLSKDFREIDFKNNLEDKIAIIEQAEALVNESDIIKAAKELQELHRKWKEDIGPVARELREEIWNRFSEATKVIHDKRHDFYRLQKANQQDIIDKKQDIIKAIDTYDFSNNKTHADWQKSIKNIEKLRKDYFDAGKLPYYKSEELWQQFKKVTKKFNSEKNKFYKVEKQKQQDNLKEKLALVDLAESLKNSEDWQKTTEIFKKIQSDWKKIGHVPRKFSDDIWKKFKGACNHYFDRYHKQKNALTKDQQKTVEEKKEIIETLQSSKKLSKKEIIDIADTWGKLGSTPTKMRHLESKFEDLMEEVVDKSPLDKNEVSMIQFKSMIDELIKNNDIKKVESEVSFIRRKIDEHVKEIHQLENNLGFISNAKADNPLVANVLKQIESIKDEVVFLKQKLGYINNK